MLDLNTFCPGKLVSAEEAISKIKRGSRVFIGTGCGEPQHLIRTLVNDNKTSGHNGLSDAFINICTVC